MLVIEKASVLEAVRESLRSQHASLIEAARAARDAATNEESKAEDQYDTRGLEASYLAGAQANRAAELERAIVYFQNLEAKPVREVGPGALVEAEDEDSGARSYYLVAEQGGGIQVKLGSVLVNVISPLSPLGEELLGRKLGDSVTVEAKGRERNLQVVKIS